MTKLEEARKQYEALGATIAAMEAEEKAKRPELARGQVWRHKSSAAIYIVAHPLSSTENFRLVRLSGSNGSVGYVYREDGFGGNDNDFTYLGMASEVITITEKVK